MPSPERRPLSADGPRWRAPRPARGRASSASSVRLLGAALLLGVGAILALPSISIAANPLDGLSDELTASLDAIPEATLPLGEELAETVAPAIDEVATLIGPTVAEVTTAVAPVVEDASPIVDLAEPVTGALAPATEALVPVVDSLAPALGALAPITTALQPVTQPVLGVLEPASAVLAPVTDIVPPAAGDSSQAPINSDAAQKVSPAAANVGATPRGSEVEAPTSVDAGHRASDVETSAQEACSEISARRPDLVGGAAPIAARTGFPAQALGSGDVTLTTVGTGSTYFAALACDPALAMSRSWRNSPSAPDAFHSSRNVAVPVPPG